MTPRHHRAAGTPSAGNSGERTPVHPWNGRVDAALPRQSRGMAAISRADEDRVKKIAVPARNPLCQSLISARSPMALPYRAPLWRSLKAPRNVFTRCSPIPTALPTARRPARRHSDAACGDRRRAEEIERVGQRTHGFPASWPQGLDGDLGSASGHRFLRWQPQQRSAPIAGRGEGVPRRPAASRPTWDGTAATPDGGIDRRIADRPRPEPLARRDRRRTHPGKSCATGGIRPQDLCCAGPVTVGAVVTFVSVDKRARS